MNQIESVRASVDPISSLPSYVESDPGVTVLLVEDENFLRDVAGDVLEAEGYRVLKARHAAEALTKFREYQGMIRLLLTDVVLPGKSGCDLAKELKVISPNLPTVFMSGYAQEEIERRGSRGTREFYLSKPFSADSLLNKVNRVLHCKKVV